MLDAECRDENRQHEAEPALVAGDFRREIPSEQDEDEDAERKNEYGSMAKFKGACPRGRDLRSGIP